MTDLLSDLETPSDAELISRVRGGDVAAYGDLFSRHVDSANRLARQLVRGPDSDDLVSEAFAKVLQVLQGGGGPDVAFRAYLLTAVRRLHIDRMRAGAKVQTSDDMEDFDPGVPFMDTAVAQFESGAAARAFATLPERWQLVLWHLEVEGQKPAEIATLLGMSANSVSALAYRAREGLRQAFLTMHLNDITETDCRWVNEHLGAYVRKGLSKRDTTKVQHHLDECRRCTAMYLELTEVNSNLRGIIAPVLLGAAAAGYLSSTGSAGGIGLAAFLGRARDVVSANAGAATAGAVAAGVAAVATAGIVLLPSNSPERIMGADNPVVRTTPDLELSPSTSPGAEARQSDVPSAGASDQPTAAPSTTPSAGATEPAALLDDPGTTSGPAALPGEPGVLPAPLPGMDQPGPAPAGPGSNPGPGPGTDPGTDPGTNPGPPVPGPTGGPNPDPGPAPNPGPTGNPDPTTNPNPEPTTNPNPGPGDGSTGGDNGGTTDPTPVANLSVSSTVDLDGTVLRFDVTGTEMPPTLTLNLSSDPGGITFGNGGTCTPVTGTQASCSVIGASGMSAVKSADPAAGTVKVAMPLDIPSNQPRTDIKVTVSAPLGYKDDAGNNTVGATYVATADLALTGLPQSVEADNGIYTVPGHLGGIPDGYTGGVTFAVAGATFKETGTASLTRSGATNGPITFALEVADDSVDSDVTLRVEPLAGFDDSNDLNNSRTVSLLAPTQEPAKPDLSLTGLPDQVSPEGDGTYVVSGTVGGIPLDLDPTALEFTAGSEVTGFGWTLGTCASSNGTKTCAVTFTMTDADGLLPNAVTISVEPLPDVGDGDLANNSKTITLVAPGSDADPDPEPSKLSFNARPTAVGNGVDYTVTATVSGIGEGATTLTFTLPENQHGFQSAAASCNLVGKNTMTCDVTGKSSLSVTFHAKLPSGNAGNLTVQADDALLEISSPIDIVGGTGQEGDSGTESVSAQELAARPAGDEQSE